MNRKKSVPRADGGALDSLDRRLLAELQEDARLSLAELGRRIGLSAPAVGERLQRLEERGVVRGYRVLVDPPALGYTLSAIIRVRPAPQQLPRVAEAARRAAEVVECHRITGEDCFILKVHLRDIRHLEELVDRFTPLGQTTTSLIQSSPVPSRGLPVESAIRPDVAVRPARRVESPASTR
ncbi:MAG TPA: Lrp/AsnC family transcriptional regulator [Methylomirabilota bacterium]|nr:Lrp/AsnC family transcriptional regulator [Methylomirabilota bacterium]